MGRKNRRKAKKKFYRETIQKNKPKSIEDIGISGKFRIIKNCDEILLVIDTLDNMDKPDLDVIKKTMVHHKLISKELADSAAIKVKKGL